MRKPEERLNKIVDLCHELQSRLEINPFSLMSSGTFQLENFHSRVLAELLNPKQRHGRSEGLMESFFELLASKSDAIGNPKLASRIRNAWREGFYSGVEVSTEHSIKSEGHNGRIDVLLCNEVKKKVLIIENKINGAPDMSRQILRYMKALHPYEIVAVVYLKPFDGKGHPDWLEWSAAERKSVESVLVPLAASCENDEFTIESWMKGRGNVDASMSNFANQYIGFLTGQFADQKRWDALCSLVAEVGPSILSNVISDAVASQMVEMLPEYIERRVLYACPPCEFQKCIYAERFECASFQKFKIGESKYGADAPELGMDVTDDTITFFVREDKKRLISRDSFSKLSMFMERVDAGFKKCRRGRLDQYQIAVNNAYDDVGTYVNRVANIIAKLSDAKAAISKALLGC